MANDPLPVLPHYQKWAAIEEQREFDKLKCTCEACYKWFVLDDRVLMGVAFNDHLYDKYNKEFKAEWQRNCVTIPKVKHHTGNGKPKGTWAGTLTMSTKDPVNESEMITAVKKLFSQKTCPVEKYAWYLEYTQNGTPHIHFIYRTADGGRILAKVFKRVWPLWDEHTVCGAGHKGGYHRLVHDEDGYMEYIAKDGGIHASNW